jgi:hypothetical protein
MTYGRDRTLIDVDFVAAESQTLSREVSVGPLTIVGVIMPAAWTGAGDLMIQALIADPSALPAAPVYAEILDEAATAVPLVTGVAASKYYVMEITPLVALGRIRLRATVNQVADRRIRLVCV